MTTEQKAKAYDEALEKAKEFYKGYKQRDNQLYADDLETIFPELRGGKEERTINCIGMCLTDANEQRFKDYGTTLKDCLAWLEKQGEPEDMGEVSDGYHTFNELYYYRMLYNAAFFNRLPKDWVHKSKRHHDGEECFGGGWFIVMANLPTGQISNHYELKDWDLFQIPEKDIADEWDGHTPQEAAERLHKFLLEKQGEQKPADKVEPKFHEGEWITNGDYTWKIVEVKPLDYILQSQDGNIVDDTISHVDGQFHSFTIEDAKDGDVLASNRSIFIFSQEYIAGKPEAHCGIMNGLFLVKPEGCWTNEECYPATKEQRDLLFQKMVEPGWEWDSEKNELKKIEQTSVDKIEPKFKVGDWIISNNKKSIYQVIEVKRGIYVIRDNADNYEYHIGIEECEKSGKLFTIRDAKDGDVLQLGNVTAIFQEYIGSGNCKCYCSVYNGEFEIPSQDNSYGCHNAIPATKEQRDILFAKMKEAGYEWNADKKELKKIEQKPTNENPTDVGHEYYSELLNNDDSDTIDEYAYQCAYCMSHDWMKETATWEDVQKAVKLGAEWQKHKSTWSEEDKNFMYDTLSNLTELKDRYGKDYGNVGKCMDWLKSLKQRIGGEV